MMRPSAQGQTPGSLGEANGEQDFKNNRVRMVKASGKMDNTVNSSQLSLHCSCMGFGLCAICRHTHTGVLVSKGNLDCIDQYNWKENQVS